MIRNNNFKYYVEKENFLNESEVNYIKDRVFGESKNTINTNGSRAQLVGLDGSEVRDYRKANEYSWPHPWMRPSEVDDNKITDKILSCVKVANKLHFKYDIDWDNYESFKLLKYEKGDGYGWHPDFGKGQESTRKLSVIVQLSDSEDYEGGDLEFALTTKDNNDFTKSTRKKGSVIIFNPLIIHRVTPIISGTRYSIVSWMHGDTFK